MKQLEEDPWDKVKDLIELGSKYTGKVTNIADYGVFVDLGNNIEGLVRTSELNWTNKNINPNKVAALNDDVEVKVIEIDDEKRRVSLSIKQCQENPWVNFEEKYNKGDILESEIKSVTDFGIFVGLDGGIDGLIHVTDITKSENQEEELRKYKKGDQVKTIILSVDAERERVSLGIKQLDSD